MATVAKNGYSYTGYTESFIAPEDITTGAALAKVGGYDNADDTPAAIGHAGAMLIEYTEFRNAGLFVRSLDDVAGGADNFTTKDINFDGQTRMDTGHGEFLIRDDVDDYFTVDSVILDAGTGIYTVTLNDTVTLTAGKSYKVVARIPDVSTAVADRDYVAGELVTVAYP